MTADTFSDIELSAFIDGELDPARAATIEARLAADPVLAQRVKFYRADMAALARLYDPVMSWPLPERTPAVRAPARPRPRWIAMAAAAAVAFVVVGTAWQYQAVADDRLVADAISARSGSLAPVDTLDDPGLAVAANAEIEARLGLKAKAPDLTKAGWKLVRAATYGPSSGRFVELRYRDAAGRIFTIALQLRSGEPDRPFEVTKRDGLTACIWKTDELEAVMLGEMKVTEMTRLAAMTYDALGI
ncbi:MAG TPA: hypothetical protein VKS60_01225 [Stellaceae bacterium]|nr:hypothetical protein [Stellaceae bacterium]